MPSGYVYLLTNSDCDGKYKIGVTRGTVENRIKKLQTGNPDEIILIDSYFSKKYPFLIERRLHQKYFSKNILNEWYELTDDEVKSFKTTCSNIEEQFKSLEGNPFFKYG